MPKPFFKIISRIKCRTICAYLYIKRALDNKRLLQTLQSDLEIHLRILVHIIGINLQLTLKERLFN